MSAKILTYFLQVLSLLRNIPLKSASGKVPDGYYRCPPEAYTFMVTLVHREFGSHHCAGTLLSNKYVLTAAQCMEDIDAKDVQIFHGEDAYTIKDVFVHPKYVGLERGMYNDIAVIALQKRINSTKDKPDYVNLPKGGCSKDITEICALVAAIGWGHFDDGTIPTYLRCTIIPTMTQSDCEEELFYTAANNKALGHVMCTHNTEATKRVCQADLGGPVFCGGRQVGIVSFGHTRACYSLEAPSIYTRVACYSKFIYTLIDEAGDHDFLHEIGIDVHLLEDVKPFSATSRVHALIGLIILLNIVDFINYIWVQ